jgi:hypothetical protein
MNERTAVLFSSLFFYIILAMTVSMSADIERKIKFLSGRMKLEERGAAKGQDGTAVTTPNHCPLAGMHH